MAIIEEIEKKCDRNDKRQKKDNNLNENEPNSELKNETEYILDVDHEKK